MIDYVPLFSFLSISTNVKPTNLGLRRPHTFGVRNQGQMRIPQRFLHDTAKSTELRRRLTLISSSATGIVQGAQTLRLRFQGNLDQSPDLSTIYPIFSLRLGSGPVANLPAFTG
ncbi:hypothetical protein N7G274_007272 [Stereocaulon virgatum]|uniref:Uncharacterized protein n=1 Tax=Stereocaulon virgatum TaxID=373712 RepID=A0ABR4A470_9LECA